MKIRISAASVHCGQNIHARGDILTDEQYSEDYLRHLVYEAGAGELLEYETKVDVVPETGPVVAPKKRKYTRRKSSSS